MMRYVCVLPMPSLIACRHADVVDAAMSHDAVFIRGADAISPMMLSAPADIYLISPF